jgi:hypothetical protein
VSRYSVKDYKVHESSPKGNYKLFENSSRDPYSRKGVIDSAIFHPEYGIVYSVVFSGDASESYRKCVRLMPVSNRIDQVFTKLTPNSGQRRDVSYEDHSFMPGDVVIVLFPGGFSNDSNLGVILGSYPNPNAIAPWVEDTTIAHYSSIIGLEQKIYNNGAYSIKFNGAPKNWRELLSKKEISKKPLVYDTIKGGTELKFIEDGSFLISDNKKDKDKKDISSRFMIAKSSSYVSIASMSSGLNVSGFDASISMGAKVISINTIDGQPEKVNDKKVESKVSIKTETSTIEATKTLAIKSPKIAIGQDGAELLSLLVELIDALGGIQVITPMGPANPFSTDVKGDWSSKVSQIKDKIKGITGSLK